MRRRRDRHGMCPGPTDKMTSPSGRIEIMVCGTCDTFRLKVDGNVTAAGRIGEIPAAARDASRHHGGMVERELLALFSGGHEGAGQEKPT